MNQNNLNPTVIYTRVSTQEQADTNKSLDTQKTACKEFAVRKGMKVIKIFIEEGESAKTADRTQLQAMLRYCADKNNNVKNVIVWKLDRLARRTEDHIVLTSMLKKYKIKLHSVTEPIEDTPSGKLMEHILASVAEFDNAIRAERCQKGMESRLKEGGWVHHSPIGYSNYKDALGRPTLKPDEQAKKVAKMLKEFSKGMHTQKHMAELARTKYNIKTKKGNPVPDNSLYKILRSPLYAGMVFGKSLPEPIKGLHEGLISYETYLKNQEILKGNRPTKGPKNRHKDKKWSLRQFIKCKYCNKGLTGSNSKGRNMAYSYYHCTKCKGVKINCGKKKGQLKHLTISRDDVNDQFQDFLKTLEPNKEVLRLFREIVLRRWNLEYKESIDARVMKEREIENIDRKKFSYIDMRGAGEITSEELKQKKDELSEMRIKCELELGELTNIFDKKNEAVDQAIDLMTNAEKIWSIMEFDDRVRFQKMVIPSGITIDEHLNFGTANISTLFKEIHQLAKEFEAQKETQNESESLLVTSPGIEPRLPG